MKKHLALLAAVLLIASACALTPRDTGNAYRFPLSPLKTGAHEPAAESLVVALPTAAPELDTYRIALTRGRWDYYAGARWVEFLPGLVGETVTKTLEDAGLFRSVTTDQGGLRGDQLLRLEIRSFQAVYGEKESAPLIKIRLSARLFHLQRGESITSFELRAERKAAGNRLPDIQAAFDGAFQDVQRALVNRLVPKQP